MRQYPKWFRRFLGLILWAFNATEEKPTPCECPHCSLERAKFETKRRKVAK